MSDSNAGLDFIVGRKDWAKTRFADSEIPTELAPGQVLFRVDRFALTSNNISYASAGDMLRYWDFFPVSGASHPESGASHPAPDASHPAPPGEGRIPAMGFGDVVASTHDGVAPGTRCFGFFPMSRHLVIEPETATRATITDGVAHREPTALVYRQYNVAAADAMYDAEREDEIMLLRGLFMTSFLAEDFLHDAGFHGAEQIIVSSASSKTGIALGQVAHARGEAHVVGLTSERNRAFVEKLGFFDEVRTYDEVDALDASRPAAYVDMAGSTELTRGVHARFGAGLKWSMRIGNTHWDEGGGDQAFEGVAPEFFFAPAQIAKRIEDWGPAGLQERIGASFRSFLDTTPAWLRVERGYGRDAVERVYQDTLAGRADANTGHILSLWDDAGSASGRG